MIHSRSFVVLAGLVFLLCLVQPTAAFGAGNIASLSKLEGVNCRWSPMLVHHGQHVMSTRP